MSAPVQTRLAWLDALRGVTIVLMVAGHVARGLWAAGRIDSPEYLLWDMALYAFHGPMLFVLGGFTFAYSTTTSPYLANWRARLRRLIHPYVVWTVIAAGLTLAMARVVNQPLGTSQFLRTVLGMIIWPYSIFWFLYVFAMCQIAAALLRERIGLGSGQLLAASVLGLGIGYVLRAQFGPIEAFQVSMFLLYFFYFCWGNWLSTRTHVLTLPVLGITAIVSLLCWYAIIGHGWSIDTPFGAIAGISMTTMLLAIFRLGESRAPRVLMVPAVYAGLLSLEIYVMHHMAAGITRIALDRLGLETLWVYGVVGLIAGVLGPVVMLLIFRRLGLAGVLGLAKSPSRPRPPSSAPSVALR